MALTPFVSVALNRLLAMALMHCQTMSQVTQQPLIAAMLIAKLHWIPQIEFWPIPLQDTTISVGFELDRYDQ
ncbi:MAG: hypothetical protein RR800_00720 [Comamonas sp.]